NQERLADSLCNRDERVRHIGLGGICSALAREERSREQSSCAVTTKVTHPRISQLTLGHRDDVRISERGHYCCQIDSCNRRHFMRYFLKPVPGGSREDNSGTTPCSDCLIIGEYQRSKETKMRKQFGCMPGHGLCRR